jgi:hypothetical protein
MKVSTDDAVYRVDNRFLGPQGITIARVGIRYQAIGVGFLLWVPATLLLRALGLSGFGGVLAASVITVIATALIMRVVDHDRPLAAQLTVLHHEITAPRPPTERREATLRPDLIPAAPLRPRRGGRARSRR